MKDPVRFSVITPTHRRLGSLLRLLDGLALQDYPLDSFEVVVVADGGGTGIAETVRERSYPFRVKVLAQDRSGPAGARNRGLAEASEPYALFLDDDVVPSRSLVREHATSHAASDVAVIGPLLATGVAKPAPWTVWEWTTIKEQYRAMEAGEWDPTPRQFWTGNASVRRDHVLEAGGFNPEFRRGEDVELALRLQKRGVRFVFNPRATSEHHAERGFRSWLAAAHEYGRTDVKLANGQTAADLPRWVKEDLHARHRYTRALTEAVLARPHLWRPVPYGGLVLSTAASRLRWHRLANRVCSAMFTAAYWRGASELLGRQQTLDYMRSLRRGGREAPA